MNKKQEQLCEEMWRLLTGRPILHSLVAQVTAEGSAVPGMTNVGVRLKSPLCGNIGNVGGVLVPTLGGSRAASAVFQSFLPSLEAAVAQVLPALLFAEVPAAPTIADAAQLTLDHVPDSGPVDITPEPTPDCVGVSLLDGAPAWDAQQAETHEAQVADSGPARRRASRR